MVEEKKIVIKSPSGAEDAAFEWQDADEEEDNNSEIVDTVKWIVNDIHELITCNDIISAFRTVDGSSFESVFRLSRIYNEKICLLRKQWTENNHRPIFQGRRARTGHLKHIIQQCYDRSVDVAEKLNQYLPFSPEVYGETSFELVNQMIHTLRMGSDDSFVDLGSGVGQVVMQVAASTTIKRCIGVEKADYPSHCAVNMEREFKRWMAFYGKPYQPFVLEKGDFLCNEHREKIMSSSVIFANNFAFGPQVDHQLKLKFANLKEGARIISSKAFCPLNFRISDRNLSDIGSIMHVKSLNPLQDAVSWTDKPFSYYIHTIDRSLLEDYFASLKNPKIKTISLDGSHGLLNGHKKRTKSLGRSGSSNDQLSDSTSEDEDAQESRRQSSSSTTSRNRSRILALRCRQASLVKNGGRGRPASNHLLGSPRRRGAMRTNSAVPPNPTKTHHRKTHEDSHKRARFATSQEMDSLDLLHRSTLKSVNQPIAADTNTDACFNSPAMAGFVSHYRPQHLNGLEEARATAAAEKDHRLTLQNNVVPLALLQYLEMVKQSFMVHMADMRSPAYKLRVMQEIEQQRARNQELKERITKFETSIKELHVEGMDLLRIFLRKVGIEIDTPSAFFSEARKLIKNHRVLELKIDNYKREIVEIQAHTQSLNGIKQQQEQALLQRQVQQQQLQIQQQKQLLQQQQAQLLIRQQQQIQLPRPPKPKVKQSPQKRQKSNPAQQHQQPLIRPMALTLTAVSLQSSFPVSIQPQTSTSTATATQRSRSSSNASTVSVSQGSNPAHLRRPTVASNYITSSLEELITQEIMRTSPPRPRSPPLLTRAESAAITSKPKLLPQTLLSEVTTYSPISRPSSTDSGGPGQSEISSSSVDRPVPSSSAPRNSMASLPNSNLPPRKRNITESYSHLYTSPPSGEAVNGKRIRAETTLANSTLIPIHTTPTSQAQLAASFQQLTSGSQQGIFYIIPNK